MYHAGLNYAPRHSSISGTLPLTKATMSSNAAGSLQFPSASSGVHRDLLANNEAIGDEFADGLAGVGVGDFVDLVGVEPDLALPASCNRGGKSLLSS